MPEVIEEDGLKDKERELEEFLLDIDLPEPLEPILGSAAWSNFAAALAQMGLLAAFAALGTFLEQDRPAEFYRATYPDLAEGIITLGFDHMYSSPVFLAIEAWLAASIVACTGTTQIPMARRAQRLNLRTAESMKRSRQFMIKINCDDAPPADAVDSQPAPVKTVTTAQSRICALRSVLERRGFAVKSDEDENPTRLVAQRGLVGKFAPLVVHLSLLLCLFGGAVGVVFGASSEVMIGDGGQADLGTVLSRGRRSKGVLEAFNPVQVGLYNKNIRVDNFRIDYAENGGVKQYYSDLVVEDAQTQEKLTTEQIFVNKPLRWGGSTIYQADWGIDRLQMYINGKGVVVPLKSLPSQSATERQWAAFLPSEIINSKDVSELKKLKDPKDGVLLIVENLRNVQVYNNGGDLLGILRSPESKIEKLEGMPVQFGETIQIEGGELRIDRIVGATGLIVKSDPGVPFVYLGFFLLMPATLLSLQPLGQVWAATTTEEEGGASSLVICGRANRNSPAFEDEVKTVVVSGVA